MSIFAWSASLLTTSSSSGGASTTATSGPFALVELVDFVQVGVAESIPLTKLAITLQLSSRLNRYRRTTVLRNTQQVAMFNVDKIKRRCRTCLELEKEGHVYHKNILIMR